MPSKGGSDDKIIVEAGWGAVTITSGRQAFHAVGGEFSQQCFVGQEGEIAAFDGEG